MPSLAELARALAGVTWFAHSSSSSLRDALRWRLIVQISRPVTSDEHSHMWRAMTERLPFKVGAASKDPSRAWYAPRIGADQTFEQGGA